MALELLFERRTLVAAINSPDLQTRPLFLTDTFFPNVKQTFGEHLDIEIGTASTKLAAFRRLDQSAGVVSKTGRQIKTVQIPAIREKKVLTAKELLSENALGNIYVANGGGIDQARNAALARELLDLKNRILRRREWMASKLLTTGVIQYASSDFAFELDYGLDSNHLVTLSGADLWTASTGTPWADLFDWSALIQGKTGAGASKIVLGKDAAKAFLANAEVKANLNNLNYRAGTAIADATNQKVATFLGTYGGFDVWMYNHSYTSDAGSAANFFPVNGCLVVGDAMEADTCAGVIAEADQTFAGEFFSKSWLEEDPSVRWLLASSRAMPVVYNVDSWVFATVV